MAPERAALKLSTNGFQPIGPAHKFRHEGAEAARKSLHIGGSTPRGQFRTLTEVSHIRPIAFTNLRLWRDGDGNGVSDHRSGCERERECVCEREREREKTNAEERWHQSGRLTGGLHQRLGLKLSGWSPTGFIGTCMSPPGCCGACC